MRAQVTAAQGQAPAQSRPLRARLGGRKGWLLAAGLMAFAVTIALYIMLIATHPHNWWIEPVDLRVYREGGSSVRHIAPWYNSHSTAPLYSWPHRYTLKFTYPPFAALVFTILSVPTLPVMERLWVAINIVALLAAIWATFGGLGYRNWRVRAGATLLVAAVVFWTEPVQRTLFLGQIELVLLALVMWDLCQPDRRWWKGAGIGIAAGIKLVPLIFIPYLLLTRRFRQAAVATGTFAATILLGFAVLPGDSVQWWLHGLFLQGGRTGFVAWEGNQSLRAIITRFVGQRGRRGAGVAGRRGGDRGRWAWPARHCWTGTATGCSASWPARSPGCSCRRSAGIITGSGSFPPWRSRPITAAGAFRRGLRLGGARPGRGHRGHLRCLAGQPVGQPGRSPRVLPGADLGAAEYQPGYLLPARRPALVRRVSLARASADRGESLRADRDRAAGAARGHRDPGGPPLRSGPADRSGGRRAARSARPAPGTCRPARPPRRA